MNRREMLFPPGAATLATLWNEADEGRGSGRRLRSCVAAMPRSMKQLSLAFDQIGGIEKLVRGKTVTVKLNLTGIEELAADP